jgi:single-strand selective monofunctional uracil DNA glycosylase
LAGIAFKPGRMHQQLADWNAQLARLRFAGVWVYNPWDYAGQAFLQYWQRYAQGPKQVIFLGMNPGPWGMAQTGIPFGEVELARTYLGLDAPIGKPAREHPARPILGWQCKRSEVSGRRLWGTIAQRFPQAEDFFQRGFVANYCPLVFMEESGRNLTPDKLPKAERTPLLEICDQALAYQLKLLQPKAVVGVGKWAEQRAQQVVTQSGLDLQVASIPHPSPANPQANRGWGQEMLSWLA